LNAIATFPTENASRHLASLCKHFTYRIPTSCTPRSGTLEFGIGRCDMIADAEGLTLIASSSDQAQLDQVVEIISRHLERFAFRENPDLTWRPIAELDHPSIQGKRP
jgi:hypothetical protein